MEKDSDSFNFMSREMGCLPPLPLYQQMKTRIKREILAGNWMANQKLPSARTLSKKGWASVITIERAYWQLEREGIIMRIKGDGYYVVRSFSDHSKVLVALRELSEYDNRLYNGLKDILGSHVKVDLKFYYDDLRSLEEIVNGVKHEYNYLVLDSLLAEYCNLKGFSKNEEFLLVQDMAIFSLSASDFFGNHKSGVD